MSDNNTIDAVFTAGIQAAQGIARRVHDGYTTPGRALVAMYVDGLIAGVANHSRLHDALREEFSQASLDTTVDDYNHVLALSRYERDAIKAPYIAADREAFGEDEVDLEALKERLSAVLNGLGLDVQVEGEPCGPDCTCFPTTPAR